MKPPFSWLPTWCGSIDYAMVAAAGESRITTSMPLWLGTFWPRPKSLTFKRADWLRDFHFPREGETTWAPRLELVKLFYWTLSHCFCQVFTTMCGSRHTFDEKIFCPHSSDRWFCPMDRLCRFLSLIAQLRKTQYCTWCNLESNHSG